MKIIKASGKCMDIIKHFEGFRSEPYLCPAGIATIGYGTTRYPNGAKVTLNDRHISEAEAESFLQNDVKTFELSVYAYCVDTITQNQFDALVDFCYNLGAGALKGSTLLRKININPADNLIREEFNKWVYSGNEVLPGLIERRAAEAQLYFTK